MSGRRRPHWSLGARAYLCRDARMPLSLAWVCMTSPIASNSDRLFVLSLAIDRFQARLSLPMWSQLCLVLPSKLAAELRVDSEACIPHATG